MLKLNSTQQLQGQMQEELRAWEERLMSLQRQAEVAVITLNEKTEVVKGGLEATVNMANAVTLQLTKKMEESMEVQVAMTAEEPVAL